MTPLTHTSLFSGIGGFDLAAEWVGWTNLFNCEKDPFCQTVLKHHFPDAEQFSDIRATDFTSFRGRVDVLTGGFPCQPFSVAGKRKGTDDDRYLWPEMLRAIREIRPRWIVGENVRGILSWSDGMVFDTVCADLEAEGYEVTPYVLPACSVNAPHRRDRVWFIAKNTDHIRCDSVQSKEESGTGGFGQLGAGDYERVYGEARINSNPNGKLRKRRYHKRAYGRDRQEIPTQSFISSKDWQYFPTQSPVCRRNDGLSYGLDGITFPKWRAESIKAYGNAIVPQVALQIFKAINECEQKPE